MRAPRIGTFLVVVLLAAIATPSAMAKPQPSVGIVLSVDSTDCGNVVLSADVDWKRIKLNASDYMIEWFAVTSFSQTLGTSAFDAGGRADKVRGWSTMTRTRDGYFDSSIYSGASYSASLRVVANGLVVGTSNLVPIPDCA